MTTLPIMQRALTAVKPPMRKSKYAIGLGKGGICVGGAGLNVDDDEIIKTNPAKVMPPRKVRTRMAC